MFDVISPMNLFDKRRGPRHGYLHRCRPILLAASTLPQVLTTCVPLCARHAGLRSSVPLPLALYAAEPPSFSMCTAALLVSPPAPCSRACRTSAHLIHLIKLPSFRYSNVYSCKMIAGLRLQDDVIAVFMVGGGDRGGRGLVEGKVSQDAPGGSQQAPRSLPAGSWPSRLPAGPTAGSQQGAGNRASGSCPTLC